MSIRRCTRRRENSCPWWSCGAVTITAVIAAAWPAVALEFRQNVAFSTGNQNLWAPGEAVSRTFEFNELRADLNVQLPTLDFDPVKSALRALDGVFGTGIGDLLGVGVSVGGGLFGEAGVSFGYHVNGGLFHMNYPARSSLDFATHNNTGALATGRDNRVTTAFLPGLSAPFDPSRGIASPISVRGGGGYDVRDLPGAGFETFHTPSFGTQFPNASAWADLYVDATASAFMQVNALFDNYRVEAPGIRVDEKVRLAEVNPSGVYVGGINEGISFGNPIAIPGVGQVTLSYPDVTVTSGAPDGAGVLRGSASKPIISFQAQLEKIVPVVGSLLSNTVGPFGYTIAETLGGPTLSLYQDVSFTPEPRVRLAFSKPVLHRQEDGSLAPTNVVEVSLGEAFDIQPMWGSDRVIDVQPTYLLNNSFTNEIGLALGVDFDIDALELKTPVGNLGPALHQDLTFSDLVRIPVANFEFPMPMTPVHARRFSLNTVNPVLSLDGASLTLQSSNLLNTDPGTGRETHRFVARDALTGADYTFDVTGAASEFFGAPELDNQRALVADADVIVTDPNTGQPVANLGRYLCYACNEDYSTYFDTPLDIVTPEGDELFVNPFFDFSSGIVDPSGDPLLNQNNYYRATTSVVPAMLDPVVTEPVTERPGILFSNLAEPHRDQTPIGVGVDEYWAAQSFTTDGQQHALRSIRAMIAATSEAPDIVAGLYGLAEGEFSIGTLIANLTPQEVESELTDVVFLPDRSVLLEADTTYWLVIGAGGGSLVWSYEDSELGLGQSTFGPGSLYLFADSEDAGANWNYYSLLNPYRMQVNVNSAPSLLGDFNGDGIVDGNDLLAWQRDSAMGSLADWEADFGAGSASVIGDAVPEPLSIALAIVAGILGVACPRRRHRSPRAVPSRQRI